MKGNELPVSWVDFITVLVVVVGVIRGRKRGLSEEILDLLQWVAILLAGAYLYKQVGAFMNQKPVVSLASCHVLSYILIALGVKLVFTLIKRWIGQKIVESDIFGRLEYYLGMVAGGVRWSCMYLFLLSMLHAPLFTKAYRDAKVKFDAYNYGADFFPSLMSIQDEAFKSSLTGQNAGKYLAGILIAPASIETQQLRHDQSMGKRRERSVDDAFGGK